MGRRSRWGSASLAARTAADSVGGEWLEMGAAGDERSWLRGRLRTANEKPLEISELACADGCGWAAQNRARESRPKEILRRDSKRPRPSQESPLPRTHFVRDFLRKRKMEELLCCNGHQKRRTRTSNEHQALTTTVRTATLLGEKGMSKTSVGLCTSNVRKSSWHIPKKTSI